MQYVTLHYTVSKKCVGWKKKLTKKVMSLLTFFCCNNKKKVNGKIKNKIKKTYHLRSCHWNNRAKLKIGKIKKENILVLIFIFFLAKMVTLLLWRN